MPPRAKIISIVGARPQFIKLAPLAERLGRRFIHRIVHTGQHYDMNMSDIFFRGLKLPRARVNLRIGGDGHGTMTGRMLMALEKYLLAEKPDLVLVYGDTNTTLAGALAAAKLALPVGHIEAGMRSFVKDMPEEINRKITDHLSTLLFCPTPTARKNLRAEGIRKNIIVAGDLMYELLDRSRKIIERNKKFLKKHNLGENEYIYLTAHRAANVDDRENLAKLLEIIAARDLPVLYPVHPRTRKQLRKFGFITRLNNIKNLITTEPLSYLDNLTVVRYARAVLTDSGGLQKEALFLGTPVLTLRNETEWVETLKKGNHLVGLDAGKIRKLLKRKIPVSKSIYRINNRQPSAIITAAIDNFLKER